MDKRRTLMIIDRALPNQNIQNVIATNAVIFHSPDLKVKIWTAEKLGSHTTELYKHLMTGYEVIQKNRSLKNIILEDKVIFLKSVTAIVFNILRCAFVKFENLVVDFSYKNVRIGDLIYDTYIREKQRFINPKKDFVLFALMIKATLMVNIAIDSIKRNKIDIILSSSNAYLTYEAIFLRVSQQRCSLTLIAYNHRLKAVSLENLYEHRDFVTKDDIKEVEVHKNWKFQYEKMIKERITGKDLILEFNNANYLESTKNLENFKQNILLEKQDRIIGLFYPHIFADSNHQHGSFAFRDYYTHFNESIKVMSENTNVLWLVREHPTSDKYNEKGLVTETILNLKAENIWIVPEGIPNYALFEIGNFVVTGRGSVGLEIVSQGLPVITTGHSIYSDLRISHQFDVRHDYLDFLRKIRKVQNVKKPNRKQISHAQLASYLLWVRPFCSSITTNMTISPQLDQNEIQRLIEKMCDEIEGNIRKVGLKNDNFYKYAVKKVASIYARNNFLANSKSEDVSTSRLSRGVIK